MSAFSQGVFTLDGEADSVQVGNKADSFSVPVGTTFAGFGNLNFQVWSAPSGTSLLLDAVGIPQLTGAWTLDTSSSGISITPVPGAVSGGTITVPQGPGNAEVVLVGWTGNATSLADAEATSSGLIGWTAEWLQATASGINPPPSTTAGALTAGALTFLIPEPSTITIGGLGAAALLYFRRRK